MKLFTKSELKLLTKSQTWCIIKRVADSLDWAIEGLHNDIFYAENEIEALKKSINSIEMSKDIVDGVTFFKKPMTKSLKKILEKIGKEQCEPDPIDYAAKRMIWELQERIKDERNFINSYKRQLSSLNDERQKLYDEHFVSEEYDKLAKVSQNNADKFYDDYLNEKEHLIIEIFDKDTGKHIGYHSKFATTQQLQNVAIEILTNVYRYSMPESYKNLGYRLQSVQKGANGAAKALEQLNSIGKP